MTARNQTPQALVLKTETKSMEETIELASQFATGLQSGDIVVVSGPIGAGKTYFVKGVAAGLGVSDIHDVNSPTYDLVHRFEGRLPVFHIDFYRLENLSDEDFAWLDEYLRSDGVCIIEWGEKFIDAFNYPYYRVVMDFGANEESRLISIIKEA